jgi:Pyridine nucleotide-disulphide oxidoreductase
MPSHRVNGNKMTVTSSASTTSWDVVIVGAGPAALACLSALQEPYSLDALSDATIQRAIRCMPKGRPRNLRVAVVDPAPSWLEAWRKQFGCLDIPHLRSPAMAHPDMFDSNAMLAYAIRHGRQDELVESGCANLAQLLPLGQTQVGLWKLPGTDLFLDFCQSLVDRLDHTYRQGWVVDVDRGCTDAYKVVLADGTTLSGNSVVLAAGMVGRPVTPPKLRGARGLLPWTSLGAEFRAEGWKRVLVVGGGLTAVQAVQKILAVSTDCRVTLCSRRPLKERHFDLHLEWFDRRTTNKCMSDFYHQPLEDRLQLLRQARSGGSVPAVYMSHVRRLEESGRLDRVVDEAEYVGSQADCNGLVSTFMVRIGGNVEEYQAVVIACGIQPDCTCSSMYEHILQRWPIPVVGGYPCLTADAEWTTPGLFCVGSLAGLSVGPDAGNLMGMRRAAEFVAHALDRRAWLRSENVLKNPFDALQCDSDSEDDTY